MSLKLKSPDLSVLHLYRHLLREISYLPPSFSSHIHWIVKRAFHRFRDTDNYHLKPRIDRGKSTLRKIKAANHGDSTAMQDLLWKGFGRTGRRRRVLLREFVLPQGANDSAQLDAILDDLDNQQAAMSAVNAAKVSGDQKDHSGDAPLWQTKDVPDSLKEAIGWKDGTPQQDANKPRHVLLNTWDREKLTAFLKSQRTEQTNKFSGIVWPGVEVRKMVETADVPTVNTWNKPPNEKVVETLKAKFWRKNADKMLPPLGKGEWELLGKLSHGEQNGSEWKVPERRRGAKPVVAEQVDPWDWQAYASKPVNIIEQKPGVRRQFHGVRESFSGPYQGKTSTRPLSDRWFERAYNRVWAVTSYAEQDPKSLNQKFTWGGKKKSGLVAPTARQLEIFEGVDSNGNIIKPTTTNKTP